MISDTEAVLHAHLTAAEDERDQLAARVRVLEEALREYAQHQSWRCDYAPHFYMTAEARALVPEGDCACGLNRTLRDLALHRDHGLEKEQR